MFGWFRKDPVRALRQDYEARMAEAMRLQRSGDVVAAALKTAEAAEVLERIEALEAEGKPQAPR